MAQRPHEPLLVLDRPHPAAAGPGRGGSRCHPRRGWSNRGGDQGPNKPGVDAIFLGFHYLDHAHEPTLRLFDPSIPVLATPQVIAMPKPCDHFTTVRSISDYDNATKSWRDASLHPGDPLPCLAHAPPPPRPPRAQLRDRPGLDALGPRRHRNPRRNPANASRNKARRRPPPVIPGLIPSDDETRHVARSQGESRRRDMNTYGAAGGLELYRCIGGAKYWVSTHNAPLGYSGIMMRLLFIYDTQRTVEWALEQEAKESEKAGGTPNFVDVSNGACLVLN